MSNEGSQKPPPQPQVNPTLHTERQQSQDHILQFFTSDHLPEPLRSVSRPFGDMAARITETLPRNPERTVALRKLLEAKDAAVRAHIAK